MYYNRKFEKISKIIDTISEQNYRNSLENSNQPIIESDGSDE